MKKLVGFFAIVAACSGAAPAPPDWPAHPLHRGFDYYYGYIAHRDGHEHYPKEALYSKSPKPVWENRTEVSAGLDKCYTTDLFAARAKQWIAEHCRDRPDAPFFLYLAFDTPHAVVELPTQAYPPGGGLSGGLQWLGRPGRMINTATGEIDSWVHPDYRDATCDHDRDPATPEAPWANVHRRLAPDSRGHGHRCRLRLPRQCRTPARHQARGGPASVPALLRARPGRRADAALLLERPGHREAGDPRQRVSPRGAASSGASPSIL